MLRASRFLSAVAVCAFLVVFAANANAAPLGVRIDDHDFTFDVPYFSNGPTSPAWGAVYDYQGTGADTLTVLPPDVPDTNHYVSSYSYVGKLSTVPAGSLGTPPVPSPFLYPVANSATFGGNLALHMTFDTNGGPYVDAITGDRFDINLVGHHPESDYLTITGQIFNQAMGSAALYPSDATPHDIALLAIQLTNVSVLARLGEDSLFLVEGVGQIKTFLGQVVQPGSTLETDGVVFFKFFTENPQGPLFTSATYQPSNNVAGRVLGHISGEAGPGYAWVPEPATLTLLAFGAAGALAARRRKK